MKIRNGFVSNSSSSSFVVLGATFDEDQIREYLEKNKVEIGNENGDDEPNGRNSARLIFTEPLLILVVEGGTNGY